MFIFLFKGSSIRLTVCNELSVCGNVMSFVRPQVGVHCTRPDCGLLLLIHPVVWWRRQRQPSLVRKAQTCWLDRKMLFKDQQFNYLKKKHGVINQEAQIKEERKIEQVEVWIGSMIYRTCECPYAWIQAEMNETFQIYSNITSKINPKNQVVILFI